MSKSQGLIQVERASMLSEFRPIASEALSVFSEAAIKFELQTLQKLLDLPKKPEKVDITEDEWREIIEDLLRGLGAMQIDQMTGYPRLLDDDEWKHALAGRVQSALRAIDYASRTVDPDGSATGLLLPTSYARRLEVLLGTGVLPVAWVRQFDVLRF